MLFKKLISGDTEKIGIGAFFVGKTLKKLKK